MPAAEAKDSAIDIAAFINGNKDLSATLPTPLKETPKKKSRSAKAHQVKPSSAPAERAVTVSAPRRKLTAMVRHSTIVALEQRYAEYYPLTGPRLEKRDIVDRALARVLEDPALVRAIFGVPPNEQ